MRTHEKKKKEREREIEKTSISNKNRNKLPASQPLSSLIWPKSANGQRKL